MDNPITTQFTNCLNRNSRNRPRGARRPTPFDKLLPIGMAMPELKPRIVPDPDEARTLIRGGWKTTPRCGARSRGAGSSTLFTQGRRGVGHRQARRQRRRGGAEIEPEERDAVRAEPRAGPAEHGA